MLSLENLQEFTKKFQTTEKNIVREYIQHLCLSYIYKNKEAERLFFKGGTSLKFIYQSPRFSEDLDFSGYFYRFKQVEDLFLEALAEIERVGINIGFKEIKSTTGGYLGLIHYEVFDFKEDIKLEISLRRNVRSWEGELITIVNDFILPYTLVSLAPKELVNEKIQALIYRGKPRDYYDLYFLLRHPLLNKLVDKKKLKTALGYLDKQQINFRRELSVLLPVSHHIILKNFKDILTKEINKYL